MTDLMPVPLDLATPDDLPAGASLMASTEPWRTLGRTEEASLALLRQPAKEVYVARRLYERLGCELVGVLRSYIVAKHDELLYRKTVAPLAQFSPEPAALKTEGARSGLPH